MRSSHDKASQATKVLERGAWAGPGSYIKLPQPTPWRLRSKHLVTMVNESIKKKMAYL